MVVENGKYNIMKYLKLVTVILHLIFDYVKWAIIRYSSRPVDTYTCLIGKTALVTGGSTGLGYTASMMLASRGCKVIIATNVECESEKNKLIETTKNPNIITKYLDLSSFDSIRKFVDDIKKTESKIDYLLNNAGVAVMKNYESESGSNEVMQINYLGHFLLTHLLVDQLKAAGSARVVFVSSMLSFLHRMNIPKFTEVPKKNPGVFDILEYYANSKFCTLVAAEEFGKRLRNTGAIVSTVDPGIIHTNIVQAVFTFNLLPARLFFIFAESLFGTDVYNATKNTIYTITSDNVHSGDYFFQCRPIHKPHAINRFEFCRKIWEKSEELVNLKPEEKLL